MIDCQPGQPILPCPIMTAASTGTPPQRRLFRVMQKDQATDHPLCGNGSCQLGARVGVDIRPDDDNQVHPGRGGLSVTPDDPKHLPLHFRPKQLGGNGRLPVFQIECNQLGSSLQYRSDPQKPHAHGFIEPAKMMALSCYQAALAATQNRWSLVP